MHPLSLKIPRGSRKWPIKLLTAEIADIFNVSLRTVWLIITGKTNARETCGVIPRITSKVDDAFIRLKIKINHFKPMRSIIRDFAPNVYLGTFYNRMKYFGLEQRPAIKRPPFSVMDVQQRLEFAQLYQGRHLSVWRSIYYADEVTFRDFPRKASDMWEEFSSIAHKAGAQIQEGVTGNVLGLRKLA